MDRRIENKMPVLPPDSKLINELKGYGKFKGYAIDKHGNAWTCKEHNFRTTWYKGYWRKIALKNNCHGYPFFIMSNNGLNKTARVHRLMGLAFVDNPNNYPVINHIDGNKSNNTVGNLEWCTHQYNTKHYLDRGMRDTAKGSRLPNAILKEHDIPKIFQYKSQRLYNKEIAEIFGVDTSCITRILNRQSWKHVEINAPS